MGEAFYPLLPVDRALETSTAEPPAIGSGLTDAEGEASGRIEAMAPEALDVLIWRYRRKPRIQAFITAFTNQWQKIENCFFDLYSKRGLATAEGTQLDGLGEIVREPRAGRADDVYRRFIGVRVLVNRSNGRLLDFYRILRQALGLDGVFYLRQFDANVVVHVETDLDPLTARSLVVYLKAAKASGAGLALNAPTLGDSLATCAVVGSVNDADLTSLTQGVGSVNDDTYGGNASTYKR